MNTRTRNVWTMVIGAVALGAAGVGAAARPCWLGWTQIGAAPKELNTLTMAYDPVRGRLVALGAFSPNTYLDETWEFDGAAWAQIPVAGPGLRGSGQRMIYDPVRNLIVLFGGSMAGSVFPTDTWTWDGVTWTQVATNGPQGRIHAALGFDSANGVVVMFGGSRLGTDLNDTWTWDGAAWTQRATGGPSTRSHAFLVDSPPQGVYLHGGRRGTNDNIDDLWLWNGGAWQQVTGALGQMNGDLLLVYRDGPTGQLRRLIQRLSSPRGYRVYRYPIGGEVWQQVGSGPDLPPTWNRDGFLWDATLQRALHHNEDGLGASNTWAWSGALTGAGPLSSEIGPTRLTQPNPVGPTPGGSIVLTVHPPAGFPQTVRWYRDGTPLDDGGVYSGAHTATLTIDPVDCTFNLTRFRAVLTDACGEWTSADSAVTFGLTSISVQPAAMTTVESGSPVTLRVTMSSADSRLQYQWRLNGQAVHDGPDYSGTTTRELRIPAARLALAGHYDIVITNGCQTTTSSANAGNVFVNCTPDANDDGLVDITDLNIVLSQFGQSGAGLQGDVNGDGAVNFADLNIVLANFGRVC